MGRRPCGGKVNLNFTNPFTFLLGELQCTWIQRVFSAKYPNLPRPSLLEHSSSQEVDLPQHDHHLNPNQSRKSINNQLPRLTSEQFRLSCFDVASEIEKHFQRETELNSPSFFPHSLASVKRSALIVLKTQLSIKCQTNVYYIIRVDCLSVVVQRSFPSIKYRLP